MKRGIPLVSLIVLSIVALSFNMAWATECNLPGGTALDIFIDQPTSSSEFEIPIGETDVDVNVEGEASVGEGVVIKDTTVVYVMDVSGSMNTLAGVDCDGVSGNDTRLVCEQVAVSEANSAAADPKSAVGETGLASYAGGGTAHNVDLGPTGPQFIVAPDYDGSGNGQPDVEDVAFSLSAGGSTCYSCGLNAALTILSSSANLTKIVIFMSDGHNISGANVNTVGPFPADATIHSFAIGSGVSCSSDHGLGSLNDVAALTTGGTCTQVTDMSDLADLIQEAIGSTLDSLEIEVDDGGKNPIVNAEIDPNLPQNGPAEVDYDTNVADLTCGDHEICVTANGDDAGGIGDCTECVDIHVIQQVAIDIKPGSFPNSINVKSKGKIPVAILSSADFDAPYTVDPDTLTFGSMGTEMSLNFCSPSPEDVNGDGYDDLVCHFNTQETGFQSDDELGILEWTYGDCRYRGRDSVRPLHAE